MPAKSPSIPDRLAEQLGALGARIRGQRRRLKVSATAAAESAGLSRVTLHRIERGEPSVTMGAYLGAIAALGLEFDLVDPNAAANPAPPPSPHTQAAREQAASARPAPDLPATIRLDDYPQLRKLAWQRDGASVVTPREALDLYEREWRHVDRAHMDATERALLQALVDRLGGGRLLV